MWLEGQVATARARIEHRVAEPQLKPPRLERAGSMHRPHRHLGGSGASGVRRGAHLTSNLK